MYLSFFGLREKPFELTANPRYLFFTGQHREALSNLEYGLSSAKAITVLIGEAGTGKTTLLRAALESERCQQVRAVFIHNPTLTRNEFVEILAHELQLGSTAGQSKASLLGAIEKDLRERRDAGQITALVVDEAQGLSDELLEEIRLLANIEVPTAKLLPLVLAGQPKLAERLNLPQLRQLKQRVALRCQLGPLTLEETASYIVARIKTAGGETTRVFTRDAVRQIHESSGGIARTISVMCDNALISGFALGRQPVDREIVLDVCRDFDLPRKVDAEPDAEGKVARVSQNESPVTRADGGVLEFDPVPKRRRVFGMLGLG
jgi:type II secretory pathway predicted ATPase ExeA